MRSVSRVAAVALVALLTGCGGGSVVDADAAGPVRTARPASGSFCGAVQANSEAARPLSGLARGERVPADLPAVASDVRRTGADVLATAPGEIRNDVERFVEAANLQLDALVASGGDPVAAARTAGLRERLESPEYAAAGQRVRAYVVENCGTGGS